MICAPLVRKSNQGRASALGYAAFCLLYLGSGSLRIGTVISLEPSSLDAGIPFLGWTIWVYLTQFALLPAAIVLAGDDLNRSRGFYGMLLATALASLVFLVWPTQLERQVVPQSGLTGLAWMMLYFADTPRNCFPSLHVALAVISGATLWRAGWRAAALLWPTLITLATLTTKQHVAWDVAGGLALAATAWVLTPKVVRHDSPQPASHAAGA